MDKIQKFLLKLGEKQRSILLEMLLSIKQGKFDAFDVKKMKGLDNTYRIRKGEIRIIFSKTGEKNKILDINFRKDIYK